MKIIIPLDVRPTIIKAAPIIKELSKRKIELKVVHTGQHYSHLLNDVFFKDLEIPEPEYNIGIGSGTHAEQVGKALIGLEKCFIKENPDFVFAYGDANMVPSATLASAKLKIKTAHIEAGLRLYKKELPEKEALPEEIDRTPEETNRIIGDHISNFLFAPTETSKKNLLKEGIRADKIWVVGNTVVDAVYSVLSRVKKIKNIIFEQELLKDSEEYFLLTLHRAENVDDITTLTGILKGLNKVYQEFGFPIVYPIHPRTEKRIRDFKLQKLTKNIIIIDSLPYLHFLRCVLDAKLVLTDSGGLQEEACILKTPCVTVRTCTERPESLEVGSNYLSGVESDDIMKGVKIMINRKRTWKNPFGDGRAAKKIVDVIEKMYSKLNNKAH